MAVAILSELAAMRPRGRPTRPEDPYAFMGGYAKEGRVSRRPPAAGQETAEVPEARSSSS